MMIEEDVYIQEQRVTIYGFIHFTLSNCKTWKIIHRSQNCATTFLNHFLYITNIFSIHDILLRIWIENNTTTIDLISSLISKLKNIKNEVTKCR